MSAIRSWTGAAASVARAARRLRRAGTAVFVPDGSIAHVEVLVFTATARSAPVVISPATLKSVERARDELADREAGRLDRRGRRPVVTVNVAAHGAGIESTSTEPRVLWLFVLDGAELEPGSLAAFIDVFDCRPELDMAYGDAAGRIHPGSDKLESRSDDDGAATAAHLGPGRAVDIDGPWLMPGFSPDRLADQYYLGHAVAFRPHRLVARDDLKHPGMIRPERIEGPWSMARVARSVAHLPLPLHTPAPSVGLWGPEPPARPAFPGLLEGRLPLVSVIIPTNGSSRQLDRGVTRLVDQAVRSVLESRYPRIEIVVVRTPGSPDDLERRLTEVIDGHDSGGRTLATVSDDRPFNFSNACNRGAVEATGEVLVFLNDDTEAIVADWLLHLVGQARKPEVGPVGARLLYEDGRVQHAGIWSRGGHPTHRYEGWSGDADGYRGALRVTQNCLAVTGACLAVERTKFELVGGFSPVFPNSYNDVDLCLKLWDRGYRTVIEPRAELYHFEASTRDPSITDDDLAALHDRWRWRLNHDPFDNPNHTADRSEEWPMPDGEEVDTTDRTPRLWPLEPAGRLSRV